MHLAGAGAFRRTKRRSERPRSCQRTRSPAWISIAAVKSIGYARWIASSKSWVLPNSQDNLAALKKLFPSLVVGPALSGEDKVEAENQESIHNHNAYALVSGRRKQNGR